MKASSTTARASRSWTAIGWKAIVRGPSLLCAGLLLVSLPGESRGGVAINAQPQVRFSLEEVRAKQGSLAEVELRVFTDTPLKSVSIAVNFDETRLRIESIARLREGVPPIPADEFSKTDVDNRNDEPGNQAREGWIHLEITASEATGSLAWPLEQTVAVFLLRFRVLENAPLGLTPVSFGGVGPDDGVSTRTNTAEPTEVDLSPLELPPENLDDGGVIILPLGEIGFFLRGDSNMDGERDLSDPVVTLGFLFRGGEELTCQDAADSNDDGLLDLSDPVYTLTSLYQTGDPHPEPDTWGPDPTEDNLCCEATGGCL